MKAGVAWVAWTSGGMASGGCVVAAAAVAAWCGREAVALVVAWALAVAMDWALVRGRGRGRVGEWSRSPTRTASATG